MNKPGAKAREDITRMLGGVANVASAVRNQARTDIQARVEAIINRMDLVKRSECDELEAMLQQARTRQEELEARVAKLEEAIAAKSGKSTSTKSKSAGKSSGKTGTSQPKTSNTARKSGGNKTTS